MNRLLLKSVNYYTIDNYGFNFKIKGNKLISFSKNLKTKINQRKDKFETLIWEDKIRDYTNDKEIFESIFTDNPDIYPRIYSLSNIINTKKYYLKPKMGSCGEGIQVLKGIDIRKGTFDMNKFLIQEYIEPDLINNKKYDIRLYYFVIKKGNEIRTFYSINGKIRLCEIDYDKGGELTNSNLIKNLKKEIRDKLQGQLYNLLESEREEIYSLIKRLDIYTRELYKSEDIGDFINLYGVDIIKDSNGKYWILEMNGNPNWHLSCDNDEIKELKKNIFDEILNLLANVFYYADYVLENWQEIL